MGHGGLRSFESTAMIAPSPESTPNQISSTSRRNRKLILLYSFLSLLLVVSAVSAGLLVHIRTKTSSTPEATFLRKPTQAISNTCSKTRYPTHCTNSFLNSPNALTAVEHDLVHISVNITLQHVGKAFYITSAISKFAMDTRVRSAFDACMELLDDSLHLLTRSLNSVAPSANANQQNVVGTREDVLTWLSASLTNQDTCMEGFEGLRGYVKDQMEEKLRDLSKLVSNSLAIFAVSSGDKDFSGIPIQNRRRKLLESGLQVEESDFPAWITRRERRLLEIPVSAIKADIVVSKDGNGTCKTISEAIKSAPQYSNRRTIIYVKAGRYEEKNLKVGRKKTNLMFIGDGKGSTIISGGKSVFDNLTTFHTASFAATGAGFIARDLTFVNWAGPAKHQAVALRVGADHAVVYRCNIIGYQDTLYVHSQRQFFRECDIYGTVDFIFGNAAVVIQNCSLYAQKPMPFQKNTITAQNRKDPNQNTGISIHTSRILPTPDLEAAKGNFSTYLGRPWKLFSRAVYMQSYIGDHIHPRGWLEWNATFALDTLYYGEYMNYGPGGAVAQRVTWPGYRVITLLDEANKFTVSQFIYGTSWLPSTGVAFLGGLSV